MSGAVALAWLTVPVHSEAFPITPMVGAVCVTAKGISEWFGMARKRWFTGGRLARTKRLRKKRLKAVLEMLRDVPSSRDLPKCRWEDM